jgi:hypothetical protein
MDSENNLSQSIHLNNKNYNENESKKLDIKNLELKKYSTIKEYLEKYLYPDLKIGITQLIEHIRSTTLEEELTKEFRLRFYENNNDYNKKQKELLKLERGSDYSEADYDYYMKNEDYNDNKSEDEENEVDPDFEDINDEELNNLKDQLEHEEVEKKFSPIAFLADALKQILEDKKKINENKLNDSEKNINDSEFEEDN